jgi:hypothetical protein
MADITMAGKGLTRWHIAKDGATSICGSGIYTNLVPAQHVPTEQRCMNTACGPNWPDYRYVSDRTIMRSVNGKTGS